MKKILISTALALSFVGLAQAQTATSTDQVPPALPPVITTGSSTVDNQVRALRKDYEAKIKALQMEYLTKLKALIGERKQEKRDERASTTPKTDNGKHLGEEKRMMGTTTASGTPMLPPKKNPAGDRGQMMGPRVEGTSTAEGNPGQGAVIRILRGFFGF
jgi:hypothetical protein